MSQKLCCVAAIFTPMPLNVVGIAAKSFEGKNNHKKFLSSQIIIDQKKAILHVNNYKLCDKYDCSS